MQANAYLSLLRDHQMEGWLSKRGAKGLKKGWKRRYCVLRLNKLEYFERFVNLSGGASADSDSAKKGEIDLTDCLKVNILPQPAAVTPLTDSLTSGAWLNRAG